MTLPAYSRIHTTDPVLGRVQDQIRSLFQTLGLSEIIDGQLVEGVNITAGTPLSVAHGLGRMPRGWVLSRPKADTRVWESNATDKALVLNAAASVTTDLWVW